MEKDSFLMGFVVGCTIPVLGYMLVTGIFDLLVSSGNMESASGMGFANRERTVYLLSICTVLIPFNYFNRKRWTHSMRGIIIPTLLYIGFWVYKYYGVLYLNM